MIYLVEGLAEANVQQVLVVRRAAPLAQRVRALGVDVIEVSGRAGAVRVLRRTGRGREGGGVAHAHDGHAHTACWLAALAGSRLDFVVSRRVARAPRSGLAWAYRKYRHPRLRCLLCVSLAVARLHRAALGEPPAVTVVRDAVRSPAPDEERDLRAAIACEDEAPLVGTVAALTPEKDVRTFVATCALVAQRVPAARFVHIGGGTAAAAAELRGLVENAGLSERFHALGFRADATALSGGLDVFLFTSQWEGLGSALLEAQARRVPVVTTDAGGTTEVVRAGRTGRVGPVGAPEVLAQAVLAALNETAATTAMTEAAYLGLARFSRERMVTATLAIYRAAGGKPG